MSLDLFSPTISLLSKVLDLRSERHTLTASNIANADTPGYKAASINFEKELKKAMPDESGLKLLTTNEHHMPAANGLESINPAIVHETGRVQRIDGNTVDLDREIVEMSKNQIMYGAMSQILRKKFDGLLTVLRELK